MSNIIRRFDSILASKVEKKADERLKEKFSKIIDKTDKLSEEIKSIIEAKLDEKLTSEMKELYKDADFKRMLSTGLSYLKKIDNESEEDAIESCDTYSDWFDEIHDEYREIYRHYRKEINALFSK